MTTYVCTDSQFHLTGNSFDGVEVIRRESPIGIACSGGNKCYANSALQFIFSSRYLTRFMVITGKLEFQDVKNMLIVRKLRETYYSYVSSRGRAFRLPFEEIVDN